MTNGPTYVLDANVFIQAARRYYSFDVVPGFWDSLEQQAANGHLRSIDRVKQELGRGKDKLAAWAKSNFNDAFVSTDKDDVIRAYGEVMAWVRAQSQFSDAAKADFASGADGWLVAYAKAKGCVVVTEEVWNPSIKRKVPIPNVCQAFDVPFVDTFEMLRRLGVRFR
ncbi:PIN domain protein [Candidatus Nitrospira inopinata]|uniref:PIN domain protein n=1 Tax=Candidatus Nitrospira inopinata TaxID=1715989 RepID=A0A0S4KNA4_9BACT|nr:PIN domain protein [Candidatus Nitrospira inopinata]